MNICLTLGRGVPNFLPSRRRLFLCACREFCSRAGCELVWMTNDRYTLLDANPNHSAHTHCPVDPNHSLPGGSQSQSLTPWWVPITHSLVDPNHSLPGGSQSLTPWWTNHSFPDGSQSLTPWWIPIPITHSLVDPNHSLPGGPITHSLMDPNHSLPGGSQSQSLTPWWIPITHSLVDPNPNHSLPGGSQSLTP